MPATTPWAASCAPADPASGCGLTGCPVKRSQRPCWRHPPSCSPRCTRPTCCCCFPRPAGPPSPRDAPLLLGLPGPQRESAPPACPLPPRHYQLPPLLPWRGCWPPRWPPPCLASPRWGPSDPPHHRLRRWALPPPRPGAPRPHRPHRRPLPAGTGEPCTSRGATGPRPGVPSAGARTGR